VDQLDAIPLLGDGAGPGRDGEDEWATWLRRLNTALVLTVRNSLHPRMYEHAGRDANLSLPPNLYRLLSRVGEKPAIRMADLATVMELDRSTISRQVAELVGAGLVQRLTDPADRRSVLLLLTPRGRTALHDIWQGWRASLASMTKDWTPEEREAFLASLERFARALEDFIWDGAPPPGEPPPVMWS
jgi:DNA-binding MarR family transcriptional regulator